MVAMRGYACRERQIYAVRGDYMPRKAGLCRERRACSMEGDFCRGSRYVP